MTIKLASFCFSVEVYLIYSVILVSIVQHSDFYIYIYIIFQIIFPYLLLLLFSGQVVSDSLWSHGLGSQAHQVALSTGFFRQEYWSGFPCPPPRDLPHPGIEPTPPALAGGFFTTEPPGRPLFPYRLLQNILMFCQTRFLRLHMHPSMWTK